MTVASGVTKTVSTISSIAVVGISLRVCRPLAVTAIAVAKTVASGVAETVSTIASIAVVGISLGVGRPLAVAIAKTAIAVASIAESISTIASIAIIGISLGVSRPLAVAAITVAKAVSSGVGSIATIAAITVVGIRVSLTLANGSEVVSLSSLNSGGLAGDKGSPWTSRDKGLDWKASGWDSSSVSVSDGTIVSLRLSLSRPLLLAKAVDQVLTVSAEEGSIPVDGQGGNQATKTSPAVASKTKTRVSNESHV